MKVIWTEQAFEDLENVYKFVLNDSPAAAKKTAEIILESIEQIQRYPELGRSGRLPTIREFIIPRSALIFIYRIHKNNIELISILHSARKWPS